MKKKSTKFGVSIKIAATVEVNRKRKTIIIAAHFRKTNRFKQ